MWPRMERRPVKKGQDLQELKSISRLDPGQSEARESLLGPKYGNIFLILECRLELMEVDGASESELAIAKAPLERREGRHWQD